jgi:predicted AlkP superfamily pyrophosphatase or phosphodiesterase
MHLMSSQRFGPKGRLFAVSLGLVPWLGACGGGDVAKKVLVIGLDGIRVDILAEATTPNIDRLIAEGFFNDQARTNEVTRSGPGWSSMLTGARTDKHLVDSNNFTGNNYTTYPDFLTRLEQVDSSFNTFAVVDWPPLGTTASGGPLLSDAIDELLFFDGSEEGYGRADSLSVDAAVDRLETEDIDAAFVYINDADEVAHVTSTYAPEYKTAIEVADVLVGQLVAAIQARPGYADEDWLILVSTDHGRTDEGGHGGDSDKERTIFFLANGPSVVREPIETAPNIVDIAVTALTHLGVEIDPAWNLDGRSVALAREEG